jgi:hypothetical protein
VPLNLPFLGEKCEALREIKDLIAIWIGQRSCLPCTGVCHSNLLPQTFWLAKGDPAQARPQAESFLKIALATAEHTYQALAWEVNARVAIAELDLTRAQVIFNHLQKSERSQHLSWG